MATYKVPQDVEADEECDDEGSYRCGDLAAHQLKRLFQRSASTPAGSVKRNDGSP